MRGPRETSCEYIFELCTEHHPVSRLQRKDLRYTGQSIDFLYLQRQKVRAFCEIRWYHGTWLPSYKKGRGQVFLMLRLSNSEAVRACTIKLLNLKVAKHDPSGSESNYYPLSNLFRMECGLRLRPVRLQRPGTGTAPVVGAQHSRRICDRGDRRDFLGTQSLRGL